MDCGSSLIHHSQTYAKYGNDCQGLANSKNSIPFIFQMHSHSAIILDYRESVPEYTYKIPEKL